jgi:hypothetical protein
MTYMKKQISIRYLFCFTLILIAKISIAQDISVKRLENNPIIKPAMLKNNKGDNINGPSLIKTPSWIKYPLGKYYLYFANHQGENIRLAYADDINGPWQIYENGTLSKEQCVYNYKNLKLPVKHVASPDIFIDTSKKEIVMYFHIYSNTDSLKNIPQVTLRATSKNGIDFTPEIEILGESYFKVFRLGNQFYAMAKSGNLYRSKDGFTKFEKGPNPFLEIQNPSRIRHVALLLKDNILYAFYSRVGDLEEHIQYSKIEINNDWSTWKASAPLSILKPQFDYEGVNQPISISISGASKIPVRELRDPAIFEENGRVYLLYTVAGEFGIAISQLEFNSTYTKKSGSKY